MEPNGIPMSRGGGGGCNYGIDRSKVTILLCDNDSKDSGDVLNLLCKCSYQVISVKSPRQVIEALNAEGPNIDIILSEVDLPKAKGLKMLKYIMRKALQRIPVIMMSVQDEATLVVKCLRLGAADYLVKPLRTNELLNLWTHMWRRRRMLGLTEKKMVNCEFDLVLSDHSDVNTNSTMFSDDDMDEKSRKSANPDTSLSIHNGNKINVTLAPGPADEQLVSLSNDRSSLPKTSDPQGGQFMSNPKKSNLKIGQSSAFFTYVKTSKPASNAQEVLLSVGQTTLLSRIHQESSLRGDVDRPPVNLFVQNAQEKNRTCGDHGVSDTQGHYHTHVKENQSQIDEFPNNNSFNPHSAYPYYLHGAMNQVMMPSSSSMYHAHYPSNHMAGMTSFPYYPSVIQPERMPHPWSSDGRGQSQTVDRREAALRKFISNHQKHIFNMKFHLLIFLSLHILQTPLTTMGDKTLIESTCKATPSYNLCMSTLLTNPKSSKGDISDLGLIMVGATKAKATRAIRQIKSIYTSRPELRRSLNECSKMYIAVVRADVPSAVQALDGGQPKFAEDGMADTAVEAQACERSFTGRGQKSPLTQMNKDIENVANVARAIIRMLL